MLKLIAAITIFHTIIPAKAMLYNDYDDMLTLINDDEEIHQSIISDERGKIVDLMFDLSEEPANYIFSAGASGFQKHPIEKRVITLYSMGLGNMTPDKAVQSMHKQYSLLLPDSTISYELPPHQQKTYLDLSVNAFQDCSFGGFNDILVKLKLVKELIDRGVTSFDNLSVCYGSKVDLNFLVLLLRPESYESLLLEYGITREYREKIINAVHAMTLVTPIYDLKNVGQCMSKNMSGKMSLSFNVTSYIPSLFWGMIGSIAEQAVVPVVSDYNPQEFPIKKCYQTLHECAQQIKHIPFFVGYVHNDAVVGNQEDQTFINNLLKCTPSVEVFPSFEGKHGELGTIQQIALNAWRCKYGAPHINNYKILKKGRELLSFLREKHSEYQEQFIPWMYSEDGWFALNAL